LSKVLSIHSNSQIVIAKGTITNKPANNHLRNLAMNFLDGLKVKRQKQTMQQAWIWGQQALAQKLWPPLCL
jgi:hypothetical protein